MAIRYDGDNFTFGAPSTPLKCRQSPLTANLLKWQRPAFWGSPYGFDTLLYLAPPSCCSFPGEDYGQLIGYCFAAFAAASLMAFRNILLIGFLAPILIAAYFPYQLKLSRIFAWVTPIVLVVAISLGVARGSYFQFRVATWTTPAGTADYLLTSHLTGLQHL